MTIPSDLRGPDAKPLVDLYNWERKNIEVTVYEGYIKGHPTLPDGLKITTLPVLREEKGLVRVSDVHYQLMGGNYPLDLDEGEDESEADV